MENNIYDIVCIGAGPAGLAFAHCCSRIGKKVLIIEKESVIGGCHRVRRVDGLFTEHGPRVYSSTYKTMIMLLEDMSLKFEDLFTPYNFKIGEISGKTVFNTLKFSELFLFAVEFIKLLFNNTHGKHKSVSQFMIEHSFTNESKDIVDRICRLTDGTSSEYYTLNQFLQLVNQQMMYTLYQPKYPNDIGLFKVWKNHLEKQGVKFMMNTKVQKFDFNEKGIVSNLYLRNGTTSEIGRLVTNNSKVILAVPPQNMVSILSSSGIIDHELEKWAIKTSYLDYITVVFHWNKRLDLPKVYGFTRTDWGIAFIVLSNYMKFDDDNSQTVISVGITRKDYKASRINKTVDECNKSELINETFLQLKESFPNLETPSHSIISPGNVLVDFNGKKKWTCLDTAFIAAAEQPYLKPELGSNLYTLGTHNGNHYYKFTSMESAITNGVVLANKLERDTKKYYTPKKAWTIRDVIIFIVSILFIYVVIKLKFD